MNKTYISIIVLVVIAGFLFFVLKNKKSEAPMPPAIETSLESQAIVNTETGGDLEGATATEGDIREFTIRGNNFAFDPSTITVKKGDKVKITFINSEGFHDFVVDEFGAATKQSQAPTTEVIEFTADKTGTFEYYCSVGSHRAMGMVGKLVVEE